jgi:hypothetical protein
MRADVSRVDEDAEQTEGGFGCGWRMEWMVEDEVVRESCEKWEEVEMDRGSGPRSRSPPFAVEFVVWIDEEEDGCRMWERRRDTVGSRLAIKERTRPGRVDPSDWTVPLIFAPTGDDGLTKERRSPG